MIKLIDMNATIEFIPSCEKGSKNPTTFHVKPSTWRNSLMLAKLFEVKDDTAQIVNEQAWIDYMVSRIEKVDNAGKKSIDEILSAISIDVGNELLTFIMGNTNLNEAQSKN